MTSLEADASVVRLAVASAKADGPVLLTGHSYGGVVITAAGHDADELLYCTATMPDDGQSATDVFPKLFTPELEHALDQAEDGSLRLNPESSVPAFFNRCSPELIDEVRPRLRPIAAECFTTPVARAAWREVPASYVVCTDDHAMAPAYQRECATKLGVSIELDCDHSLFYTATDALIDRIIEIAARLSGSEPAASH